MDDTPLSTLLIALAVSLVLSGFFSIAETAMMAVNRYRLRHRAKEGRRGAKLAVALLAKTDKLLGVILLGNTLVAAGAATLTAVITKRLFGEGELALALGTVAISFGLLIFSEITPKVLGAAHADRLAPVVSFILTPLLKAATPIVWFVNLFVQGFLKLLHLQPQTGTDAALSQEEIRSLVLEGHYFRGKHRAMLALSSSSNQLPSTIMSPPTRSRQSIFPPVRHCWRSSWQQVITPDCRRTRVEWTISSGSSI